MGPIGILFAQGWLQGLDRRWLFDSATIPGFNIDMIRYEFNPLKCSAKLPFANLATLDFPDMGKERLFRETKSQCQILNEAGQDKGGLLAGVFDMEKAIGDWLWDNLRNLHEYCCLLFPPKRQPRQALGYYLQIHGCVSTVREVHDHAASQPATGPLWIRNYEERGTLRISRTIMCWHIPSADAFASTSAKNDNLDHGKIRLPSRCNPFHDEASSQGQSQTNNPSSVNSVSVLSIA
ncbi:predicted protein [Histoplasma capsulatum var. duboisii H88]|uniref:Predicted protein n=1 Tax=Ajellomyces capsulatus (strain H88) TaxID=544711 RepID=F0ULC7_AJEC8|nr:predicted protein [Histoplasma capsulatum var. duboisii H88]